MTDPDTSVVPVDDHTDEEQQTASSENAETSDGEVNHKFNLTSFKMPTYCKFCDRFIWGWYQQGYRCEDCKFSTHRRCHEKVKSPCYVPNNEEDVAQTGHHFDIFNFKQPTYCKQCSGFIFGFFHQGYRCHNCKYSTHKRCVNIVGHRCSSPTSTVN